MKRNDWLLLGTVLITAILALMILYAILGGTGDEVVVTVDGRELLRLPLKENTELVIEGYGGGTNTLVIRDGAVFMGDASCPDKICMHTGKADELKSIVCAPNRVVVSIEQE